MPTSEPIIQMRWLKNTYEGKQYVLRGIDLDIYPGQIIGYIGPNGAGKTTTVKILIGMLPDFEGEVLVFGSDVSEKPLWVWYTLLENVRGDRRFIGLVAKVKSMWESFQV